MSNAVFITTPVGRFVQGDAFVGQDKDLQGNPRRDRAGNARTVWFVAIAIPKGPEADALWAAIQAKAQIDFPNGESQAPGFAWKVVDGDAPENQGKDGFAGCIVIKCQSSYPPKVYDNSTPIQAIVDPSAIKRGDFVQAQLSVVGNRQDPPPAGKPGVFVNCAMLRFVAYGPAIAGGADPNEVFGGPAPVPPGGSLTPTAVQAPGVAAPGPGAPVQPPQGAVPGAPPAAPGVPAPAAPPGAPMPAPGAVGSPQAAVPGQAPYAPGAPAPAQPAPMGAAVGAVPAAAPPAAPGAVPGAAPAPPAAVPGAVPPLPGAPAPGAAPPGFMGAPAAAPAPAPGVPAGAVPVPPQPGAAPAVAPAPGAAPPGWGWDAATGQYVPM